MAKHEDEEDEDEEVIRITGPNSNLRSVRSANAHDADPVRSGGLVPGTSIDAEDPNSQLRYAIV